MRNGIVDRAADHPASAALKVMLATRSLRGMLFKIAGR
jgi:hypothetical protein